MPRGGVFRFVGGTVDFIDYLLSVRAARGEAEWARERLRELDEGVPIGSPSFEAHSRGGNLSDRTALLAISRIRRRAFCTKTLEDAMKVLNEFKGVIQDADLNDEAAAALWMRWGMRRSYQEIGRALGMSSIAAMGLIHEAEGVIKPSIERLYGTSTAHHAKPTAHPAMGRWG